MNEISDADFLADAYIQEGVSPAPGVLIAACTVGDDDIARNKVGVRRQNGWLEFGLTREAVLSVDAHADGAAYVLGEHGSVVAFDWRTPTSQAELKASRQAWRNPAVESLGPLRRLRLLGRDVLCAGSVGQAYRVDHGRFEALPPLRFGDESLTIEDIAGPSASDVVAVTSDGLAAHFDGTRWERIELPTSVSLSSIARIGDDCAIAGRDGTVLRGQLSQRQWSVLPPIDALRDYWGVALVGSALYVSHLAGVDQVVDGVLVPVPIAEAELQFTVLRAAEDGVWSFADRTIGQVVGDQWRTVVRS